MDMQRIELEFSIIGSLISAGGKLGESLSDLSREDFSNDICQSLFTAIRELFFSGAPVDKLSLRAKLGEDYSEAIEAALKRKLDNLPYYIGLLREAAKLAELKLCGVELSCAQSIDVLEGTLEKLNGLMVTKRHRQAVSMNEAMQRFFQRHEGEAPKYLEWGFAELDSKLYGEPGDFIVVGGYPSAGKTLLAMQFALTLAKKYRVGFFSLETTADKLTDRLMSHKTQIPMERIKTNALSKKDWEVCADAAQELSQLVLDEIPASGMSAADIQAYTLSHRYEVIFIDYLQLVRDNTKGGRYEQVTNISQALHTLAQSCGVTVVALAQLSRPDKSQKKPTPPNMSSFRESGQIEQDADIALLLYQEELNDYRSRRVLKIGKNKEGERGSMLLDFHGETQTLSPAKPTKSEQYANAQRACRKAMKEHAKREAVPGQGTFYELAKGEGGELPF